MNNLFTEQMERVFNELREYNAEYDIIEDAETIVCNDIFDKASDISDNDIIYENNYIIYENIYDNIYENIYENNYDEDDCDDYDDDYDELDSIS